MTLTFGSVFSGIGSFDVAFERAGFACQWQVEIEPSCRSVLARHWPDVQREADICTVGRHNLAPVDVIIGGSPCQDLSVAGKRAGLEGQRSGLFYEQIRVIDELRPALALWENVVGALSSHAGRDFAAVLGAFRELGARDICWRVLDAQHAGVPQRRRRVFVVADFAGERAAEVLLEPARSFGHTPSRRKAGTRVAAGLTRGSASGRGVNEPGRRREDDVNIVTALTQGLGTGGPDAAHAEAGWLIPFQCQGTNVGPMGTLRTGNGHVTGGVPFVAAIALSKRGHDEGDLTETLRSDSHGAIPMVAHSLSAEGVDASEDGTGRGTPLAVVPILEAGARQGTEADKRDGLGIGKEGDPMFTLQAGHQHAVGFAQNQRGEVVESDTLSLTTGGGKPGQGYPAVAFSWQQGDDSKHGKDGRGRSWITRAGDYSAGLSTTRHDAIAGPAYGVRRLTPVECERLQGLDDGHTALGADGTTMSDSVRYRMVGNAGAVPVIEWIARRMEAELTAVQEAAS